MPFDFNAYQTPVTFTPTSGPITVTFTAPSGFVRFTGTNLSYNPTTGNMAGTVAWVDILNASGSIIQTMTPSSSAALLGPFAVFTQHAIMASNKIQDWFTSKVDHTNAAGIVFGGTTLSIPVYDSANVLLGYVKATGTGLTSAGWAAGTGVITSMWHADTSGAAVAGHTVLYGAGTTSAYLDYGLLYATKGTYGHTSLIDSAMNKGNETWTATSLTTTITGGIGNDTYDVAGFTVTITDTGGVDTIKSTASRTIASAAFMENITLTGTAAADAIGNANKNVLIGNSAANTLTGAAGDDTLTGNDGIDTLNGGDNNDKLDGGLGNDTVKGDAGNDLVVGGDGLDNLYGGLGKDTLTGGAGADKFFFTAATDSNGTGRDTITDFVRLTDKIDVSGVDANTKVAGNQAFTWKGTAAFTGVAGQLHYKLMDGVGTVNDKTIIEGDLDGNKIADFYIELTGLKALTNTDFVL